jgi:hypothetical protein
VSRPTWRDGWQPPRCSHGHILLGCPHDDCPEQGTYLAAAREQILNWEARLQTEARRLVREELGLPPEPTP